MARGKIFSVIGLSGSGKSTIIRCFNQLIRPTDGHVHFEGRAVDSMGKRDLLDLRRTKISMVSQNFGLFTHRSVLDNVVYGLEVRGTPRSQSTGRFPASTFGRTPPPPSWQSAETIC